MFEGYQVTSMLTTNPFEWKNLYDGPQSVKPLWRKTAWRLHALMATAQAVFAAIQCCRYNLDDEDSTTLKIYMVFSAIFYSFDVWLQLANWQNQENLPRFVRGYVRFFKDLERKLPYCKALYHNSVLAKACALAG